MKSEKETPKHEGHFIRTLNYLKEHYTDDARLDRIAEEAGLSPWHWHRIYRSLMCETMHETVKRRRLYRAARLIAYSDKPFADIARECGYNNAQSFARSFRKAYGMLPQQYRDHRVSYSHPVSIEDRAAVPVAMLAHPGDCQQIARRCYSAPSASTRCRTRKMARNTSPPASPALPPVSHSPSLTSAPTTSANR